MAQEEATRTCGQCHREVAEANFALHETHCSRFLCLCPDCDEAVPRDQLSQHKEEQHTQVRCSKCHKKMERRHLEDHEADECAERLQSCEFCELELPCNKLQEHSLVCGSRTERCQGCRSYVKLCDQRQHALTCSGSDDDTGSPRTNTAGPAGPAGPAALPPTNGGAQQVEPRTGDELPWNTFGDLERPGWHLMNRRADECAWAEEEEEEEEDREIADAVHNALKSFKSFKERQSRPEDEGDPDKISPCPHCHLALPLRTLRWHQAKCRIHVHLN